MTSVSEHYQTHLAPVYSWMAGGMDNALSRGQQELVEIGLISGASEYAVDLGAGFGMHSIPLARYGWKVLAIDSSALLLSELNAHRDGAMVMTAQDDLLSFPRYLSGTPEVFLCMGDTLTHLAEKSAVEALTSSVAEHLPSGGRFVVSFRDYTKALAGTDRFIPVKGDEFRILTCFLEYSERYISVHDILHERNADGWGMRVSAYRKLRLDPEWVKEQLERCGFVVSLGAGLSGMVRIVATRV